MAAASRRGRLDLIDRAGCRLGAWIYRRDRSFGASLTSDPLPQVVRSTSAEVADLEPGVIHPVVASTPSGRLDAACLLHDWQGSRRPTVLFVHGSGETPFDAGGTPKGSFRNLLTRGRDLDVNVIAVRAPFHDGSQCGSKRALAHLDNDVGMLAATTALLSALTRQLRDEGCPAVHAVGISLGGWVVNLHRDYHGDADHYVPMIAGTRPSAVFTTSIYRRLVAEETCQAPDQLRSILDVDDGFRASRTAPCAPLLARYDRLVELEEQLPGCDGLDLRIIDKGHFTGMAATRILRDHVHAAVGTATSR
ncbi:MAG: hypothetical protein EA388_00360 [Nitriliruptor sp.]|nr:MAG: hypothetical protein EA388_00360 [Nitriliruptor sp.]